jgi:hypothetical protein
MRLLVRSATLAALVANIAGVAACGPSAPTLDASPDASSYSLSIAAATPDGYAPLAPDAAIEMRVGFQGFQYTRVVLVATGAAPSSASGRAWVEVEGFERAEQFLSDVPLRALATGERVSAPLLFFANDITLASAVGRRARITVALAGGATASHEGVVRWDPTCIEEPDFRCRSAVDAGGP